MPSRIDGGIRARSVSRSKSVLQTFVKRTDSNVIEQLNAEPELAIVECAPDSGFTRLACG
jgi:hypothetical protein